MMHVYKWFIQVRGCWYTSLMACKKQKKGNLVVAERKTTFLVVLWGEKGRTPKKKNLIVNRRFPKRHLSFAHDPCRHPGKIKRNRLSVDNINV